MTMRPFRRPGTRPVAFFCAAAMLSLIAACGDGAEPAPEVAEQEAPVAAATTETGPGPVIVEPANGAELDPGPLRVVLDARDITIVPAGDTTPNSGHHHLLLNVSAPAEGQPIPAGQEGFVHLGQAQTEYTFENVRPGDYTLLAVIGDGAHRVLPQVIDTVQFTVLVPGE